MKRHAAAAMQSMTRSWKRVCVVLLCRCWMHSASLWLRSAFLGHPSVLRHRSFQRLRIIFCSACGVFRLTWASLQAAVPAVRRRGRLDRIAARRGWKITRSNAAQARLLLIHIVHVAATENLLVERSVAAHPYSALSVSRASLRTGFEAGIAAVLWGRSSVGLLVL